MQINPQNSGTGDTREIIQALMLKKALTADGQQKLRLLESADGSQQDDSDADSKVGRYLDAKA